LAGAISDISKLYMRHDFRHIDTSKARVILIEGSPRILAAYPEDLSKKAVEQLAQLGVEVHTGQSVMDVQARLRRGRRQANGRGGDVVGCRRAGLASGQDAGRAPTDKRGCTIVDIT
jgi:NADH dehydrogenase